MHYISCILIKSFQLTAKVRDWLRNMNLTFGCNLSIGQRHFRVYLGQRLDKSLKLQENSSWWPFKDTSRIIFQLTSITVDSIWLTMVFGHFVVNEAHNVGTNWSLEDSRQANGSLSGLVFLRIDGNLRTSRGQRLQSDKMLILLSMQEYK